MTTVLDAHVINTPPCFAAVKADVLVLQLHGVANFGEKNQTALFTPVERGEISQMKTALRRQEKMAGKIAVKWLACEVLSRWHNERMEPSLIEVLSPDSPVLVGVPSDPRLDALLKSIHFSLSHAGDFVGAAASRDPVGIDIEKIGELTPEMQRELGVAFPLQAPLSMVVFTQKEAVLKAAGVGLGEKLSSVELGEIAFGKPVEASRGSSAYRVVSALDHGCVFTLACELPRPAGRKAVMPSATQEAMWFMDQLEGFGATHTVGRIFRLRGALQVEALAQSIQYIVNRHEVLRTVYREEAGQCRVDILEDLEMPLAQTALGHLPIDAALAEAKACCRAEMMSRFDLAHGPLMRCRLFCLGPADYLLFIEFHHSIIDADSLLAFRRELALCYRELSAGRHPGLPPLPLQYSDYARQQRERLTPGKREALLEYWRTTLEGCPACLNLPLDRPRPPYPTFESGNVEFPLPGELLLALRKLRKAEEVTLYVTFLTAFEVFLQQLSGQADIVVGVPFVDRREPDLQQLIGCFVNLLPVRADLSGAPRFRELLKRTQAALKAAMAHHELPFSTMVEKLAPRSREACPPIFQASLLLLREESEGMALPGVQQEYRQIPAGGCACDLNLYLLAGETAGQGRWEYNRNLFDEATIQGMADQFLRFLGEIGANPDGHINEFPSLSLQDKGTQEVWRTRKRPSAVIIGSGTLAIRCGDLLLERGVSVLRVITGEVSLLHWARRNKIPCLNPGGDLVTGLGAVTFDYLFSIFNVHVLPEALLGLPVKGAINYHDALLPRYAGLHAPSWALLNGESSHGITWHKMVSGVDEGDVLIQRKVEISPEDTALSLNGKCFDAAVDAFGEWMDRDAAGTVQARPQDLSQRTYYPKYLRPEAAGIISWSQKAQSISALIRALDFGPFENPLCLPKIETNKGWFIATTVRVLDEPCRQLPGTVLRAEGKSLSVATATSAVEISGLMTLEGEALTADDCRERFGVSEAVKLITPDAQQGARLKALCGEVSRHESFWVQRLETLQPLSLRKFLHDCTPPSQAGPAARLMWSVPPEVNLWLEKQEGAWQPGEFLLAAFGGYVACVAQLENFDVGFVDEAPPLERADSNGLFVRQIPFRFRVESSAKFEDLLALTRRELAQVRRRKTFARDVIPRQPQLRGQAGLRGPFVLPTTVIMGSSREPTGEVAGGELSLMLPTQGGAGCLAYNAQVFDESSARRIIQQFTTFMMGVVAEDRQPMAGITVLAAQERELLLGRWSASSCVSLPGVGVHTLIEQQAAKNPSRVAVVSAGGELTYCQLNEQANRLAHYLQGLGVGPESKVGLCIERSLEMVVGLMAILKAGGAYVPLDPAYPKERLAFMLNDAQPGVILTQTGLKASIPGDSLPVVSMDHLPDQVLCESTANPVSGLTPGNLAYVLYTSGSTGQPKGVQIEHRSLVNYTLAAVARYAIDAEDRMLQFASINFDASAEEIYPCLAGGATLVLRTEDMLKTAATFLECCQAWKVTLLDLPTAYWSHLAVQMERENLGLPPLIRLVIIGGESTTVERVTAWRKRVESSVRLFNTYGPTEATIVATWCELEGRLEALPIGRPVPNVQVYVLDARLQPVPIGMPGELWIGGAGLARGYLNQPDLTRERFIRNPFSGEPAGRLYKTGDRVRFLPDGALEFIGRNDHQIKLRGFRVELNEIEVALARHPAIHEAVVIVREDSAEDQRLVAYVVPVAGATQPGVETLRNFLKQTLPEHMIPAAIVILEELPLSPTGKINRQGLPVPDWDLMGAGLHAEGPRNLTEEILADIWCDVLGLTRAGIHDNFFDKGGHSLLGVKLVTQIREAFQTDLPLRNLFQAPTIAELARMVEARERRADTHIYLLEVQKGRRGAPLFFIPGGGGGEKEYMVYARMMRQLGHDIPVFGFRAWGLDGRTKPHNSVKSLAAAFMPELRGVQPRGPYFLAGECLGGILAFELARQLRAAGETVAFLGMLDTSCPSVKTFFWTFMGNLRLRMTQFQEQFMQWPWRRWLPELPNVVRMTVRQMGNDLGYVGAHPRETDEPEARQRHIKRVSYAYSRTLLRYRPEPYDGKITMLLTDHFTGLSDPPEAWRQWARGGLEIRRVAGDHKNYVRDHAATTGAELRECLARIQRGQG